VVVLAAAMFAVASGTSSATAHAEPRATHLDIQRTDDDDLLDACPLDGPASFEDSWGWARSGGRSHEGVDMIADRGVPVIAVRDGDARFNTNSLGGRAIWLTTDDGDKFYYAHLDDWEGESRTVRAGDVIGYVGSTGNAHGPHLHFETHPDGEVENPYGHTLVACVPDELVRTPTDRTLDTSTPTVSSPTRRRSIPLA
jgi:murein DD-endopeptidase MepM/ murein hydrolase activator NlpD